MLRYVLDLSQPIVCPTCSAKIDKVYPSLGCKASHHLTIANCPGCKNIFRPAENSILIPDANGIPRPRLKRPPHA